MNGPDRERLRELAARKVERCAAPENVERRAAWYRLDEGPAGRAMILAEVQGVTDTRHPIPQTDLRCVGELARRVEKQLLRELYDFEVLRDDRVLEPVFSLPWKIDQGDYGVPLKMEWTSNEGRLAGRHWDPPLKDLDRDFARLRPRRFGVDRAATLRAKEQVEEWIGDRLAVRLRGSCYWTMGLTWRAIELVGLESLMLLMYDNPAGLHRLMAFLRDDHAALLDWLESEGLNTLNNAGDGIGSGSLGFTHALPQPDWTTGAPVRTKDLWGLLESQETVGVGPDLFEEFVMPYQVALAARFGRVYYGCCEPVHGRWHVLQRMPNLARVSVSPWADQERMAEVLGARYVFSRKPSPALISSGHFDETAIRADLRATLKAARHCRLEIIMKDVHTLNDEPWRLPRWVALAREEAAAAGR